MVRNIQKKTHSLISYWRNQLLMHRMQIEIAYLIKLAGF